MGSPKLILGMKLESHENSFRKFSLMPGKLGICYLKKTKKKNQDFVLVQLLVGVDQEQKFTNQLLYHLKFKAIRADLVLRCAI